MWWLQHGSQDDTRRESRKDTIRLNRPAARIEDTTPTHGSVRAALFPIKGARRTIVILSLALAGCRGQVVPTSPTPELVSLRLLADSATAPLLRELAASYRPSRTVIAWNIQVGEFSTLLDWLKAGEAPYALTHYLPSTGMAASPLWTAPIGQDGIAFVINPGNPTTTLTLGQLRSILQGRVDNWKALGGADLPLTVIAQSDGSGAAILIQSIVLGDRQVTRTARLATTAQAVIAMVAAEPGAIGYISMGLLTGNVRAIAIEGILPTPDAVAANQYPIRAPLVFAGPRPPEDDVYRAFFAWAQSPDGQTVVRRRFAGLSAPQQ